MLVKTITDNENGRKWKITKMADNLYSVTYFEFYQSIGWRKLFNSENYTKDAAEWTFGIKIV